MDLAERAVDLHLQHGDRWVAQRYEACIFVTEDNALVDHALWRCDLGSVAEGVS
jgi:hypothetical protein